ncbi:MAG: efflux RND transporter periplasmic adaptor subunit [Novosphingobium sp.]|nr:efflux RND transporter periplasmic adaptor subunit [Novosphingobium sp.]
MNYDAKIDTIEEDPEVNPVDPLAVDDEEDRASKRRVWVIGALATVLMIGLWFLLHRGGASDLDADAAAQAPVVSVTSAKSTTIAGRISATGTLAARRELPVGSVGEGGQVERVLVEPGDWVRAGQVLATIDRSVQSQQQQSLVAQIQVAEADARLAQSNLDRALQLVDRGFISKADVDRLTATRDAANARVRVSQAQLGEMRARTRRLDIVAPEAGLLLERNVEPGQVVSGGSGVLFRIAKGGEMEMLARLSEEDLTRLASGVSASVTPVGTDKSFTGQVWQISPIIDPQTRQGEARIALSYAPELRPGGFASAEISSGTVVAPLLPESAILSDNDGSYVYVVDKDNKARRRRVKTGTITDEGIIVTDGLNGSEKVVLRAGAFLSDGETIKPRLVEKTGG